MREKETKQNKGGMCVGKMECKRGSRSKSKRMKTVRERRCERVKANVSGGIMQDCGQGEVHRGRRESMGECVQERGTTCRAAKAGKGKGYTGEGKCVQERENEQWKGGKRLRVEARSRERKACV